MTRWLTFMFAVLAMHLSGTTAAGAQQPPHVVRGRIVQQNWRGGIDPLARATIELVVRDSVVLRARSDTAGRFRLLVVSAGLSAQHTTEALIIIGVSAGVVGVTRAAHTFDRTTTEVGLGIAGVGARLVTVPRWFSSGPFRDVFISLDGVYAPWRWGPFREADGIGTSVGLRRQQPRRVEFGVGYLWLRDGTWWGQHSLPTVRLQVGY